VVDVIAALKGYNTDVTIYDPWANTNEVKHEYGLDSVKEIPKETFDAIVLSVAHNEFKEMDFISLRKEVSVLFDVKGVLNEGVDGKL
jgi:UDP-N-acetyl-D-galactosamine dehydrogenase